MILADAMRLVGKVRELKALFVRADVGQSVTLNEPVLRMFSGRWKVTFQKVG